MKSTLLATLLGAGTLFYAVQNAPAMAQIPGAGTVGSGQAPGGTPPIFPNTTSPESRANGPADTHTHDTAVSQTDDKKFVQEAALGGMTEVELGQLAVHKASREEVKQFGQKMVADHLKANEKLRQLAKRERIMLPDTLDPKRQARVERLSKLSGAEFDKAYLKVQLKDHEQDVAEFQKEAQNGTDRAIKTFASSTLLTLQEHLSMVKSLDRSEKASR